MIRTVLVLDDDQEWLDLIAEILEENGYEPILCLTLERAIEEVEKREKILPSAYLVDALVRDPETGEIIDFFLAKTFFEYLQFVNIDTKNFFLFTAHISREDQNLAKSLGIEIIKKDDLEKFNFHFPKHQI